MREFASITVIVTICFLTTDAVFMDGRYSGEMWKSMNSQITTFSRATSNLARQMVP